MMGRLKIRTRLALLSAVLLAVLALTTGYLTHQMGTQSAAVVEAADLLDIIDTANDAHLAFGEIRYWNTDLAVSLLTQSERNAAAARARMERALDRLASRTPDRVTRVRAELAEYEKLAGQAVDAYT